jgi:HK97 family phage prohead protease
MKPEAARSFFMGETREVVMPIDKLEWRESSSGDGSRILTGYAAVHNQETTIYSGSYWTMKEVIQAGAFNAVLSKNPDVHLVIGHDMSRAVARTGINGIGGLELTSDAYGLKVYARLNPDDPDCKALAAKMDLGIMDQMSFAFKLQAGGYSVLTTTDEVTGHETDLRTITEIAELYDVSVVSQGAYPQTEAALRSLMHSIQFADRRSSEVESDRHGGAQGTEVPRNDDGAQTEAVKHQLLVLSTRARIATNKYQPRKEA